MPTYDEIIVTTAFLALLLGEFASGMYKNNNRQPGEWLIDGISFIQLGLIKPTILFTAFLIAQLLFPEAKGSLKELPFWIGFLIVFIPDDFSHYWVHRLAHNLPWLWGFHRTHHTPNVYHAAIAFRENWLWFWIMPGLWWTGIMVYLGLTEQAILSAAIIGTHNVWLHHGSTKDQTLYKHRLFGPLMQRFEYVINTPGLHRGHHGLGKNSVPYGNFGQTLSLWDVIFGTATFNKGAPPEYYGTTNPESMKQRWYYQLWWPIFKKQTTNLKSKPPTPQSLDII